MPTIRRVFLLSLATLLTFSLARAEECRTVRSFDAVHSKDAEKFEVFLARDDASALPKKLLPFVYTTTSQRSYDLYGQARKVLGAREIWTRKDLEKARGALEKAIQADYNNVPAYLALAETLAAEYRLTPEAPLKTRALTELQKAKLLLPPLAKRREPGIRWYLEGKAKDVCGGAS